MRRAFVLTILLLGLIWPAVAGWQSRDSNYNIKIVSGGFTPSCAQSSTFLAAATGVTLTADKTNYDTLICGLVSDGVWNFDVLYIWAAPTQATALINLANPGTFNGTLNGTTAGLFTAYQGFTGNGAGAADFYIDSGFNPSTATTPNFVQNSANFGVYVLSNRSTSNNFWEIGSVPGSVGEFFAPLQSGGLSVSINSASQINGGSPASSQGSWNATRINSSRMDAFLNSSETTVNGTADTSQAPANANIVFFTFQNGFGNTSDQMASGWIGKGLSNVDSCKVNNRINTYMATLSSPQSVYTNSAC